MKKTLLLALAFFAGYGAQAQTPQTSATLDITLQCAGGTSNRTGIAYNPNQQLYYSVNAGSSGYPIETFDIAGTQVATVSQGFDYRGAWWNPNTGVLEGNGYNTLGIWIQDLDASFYALGTGTTAIAGVSGPDSQSSANYDSNDDEVLYYLNGSFYRYDRATHNLITTTAITGLPVGTGNLNSNSVAYTGVTGMEIGVYDYVTKAFYFINKTTGAYVMTCQLPVGAPAASIFKFGFANGRLWLYNETTSQWESYVTVSTCTPTLANITEVTCNSYTVPSGDETYTTSGMYLDTIPNGVGCDSLITIDLTINTETTAAINETACFTYTVPSGDETYTTSGIYNDTIMNSMGCDSIMTIDVTINVVDTATSVIDFDITANASGATYQWIDCGNGNSIISGDTSQTYTATANGSYAVIVTENGCSDTSACVAITTIGLDEFNSSNVILYPNPSAGNTTIQLGGLTDVTIEVRSINGQLISKHEKINAEAYQLEMANASNGVYFVNVHNPNFERNFKLLIKK